MFLFTWINLNDTQFFIYDNIQKRITQNIVSSNKYGNLR